MDTTLTGRQVLIVGAGPVGLALAIELGQPTGEAGMLLAGDYSETITITVAPI